MDNDDLEKELMLLKNGMNCLKNLLKLSANELKLIDDKHTLIARGNQACIRTIGDKLDAYIVANKKGIE